MLHLIGCIEWAVILVAVAALVALVWCLDLQLRPTVIKDVYCEPLHFDEALLSPRRILKGLRKFAWYCYDDQRIAVKVGLWTFLKYEGRPYHQCMETGKFCGE